MIVLNFWPIIHHTSLILRELDITDTNLESCIYIKIIFYIFRTTMATQEDIADVHDVVAAWTIIKLGHFESNMNEIHLNTAIQVDELETESQ